MEEKVEAIFTSEAFRLLASIERQEVAVQILCGDGKQILLRLPRGGARKLRDGLTDLIQKHPEMETWDRQIN